MIPYILFKAVFRYPLYIFVLLLFVGNPSSLVELLLFRNRIRNLDFRFGLGRHILNIDYLLLFARLILHGVFCYRVGEKVFVAFKGGLISCPDARYTAFLTEPYEKLYKVFDLYGAALDVGGYCGETAFLLKKWGATKVVVYEADPVLAKHARVTLLLNGVRGVVHELCVNCPSLHNSISWDEILKEKFDMAKVDCEGCEIGLLTLSDDQIRKVPRWIIECHDSQTLKKLSEKFQRAGFTVTFKPYTWRPGYHILGNERIFHPQAEIPEGFLYIMTARLNNGL